MNVAWQRALRVGRAYLWSILIWLSLCPVDAAEDKVRLLERGTNTPYWMLLLGNGVWLLSDALLTPPIFAIVRSRPIDGLTRWARIAGYALGSALFVVVSAAIRWVLLPEWDAPNQRFGSRSLSGFVHSTFLFAELMWAYIMIVVAAHAYWYFIRVRDQEVERAELKQALATSELKVLKSQLHPHFLFNTLHGISALIDADPFRARAMVIKVSSLLRTALQYGDSDLITLEEELKFVEDYLDLEKTRLENRLEVRLSIDAETRAVPVPQLILQPLVENAILHGVACSREGGWIEVTSRKNESILEIQIRNSVCGERREGTGLGLQNTRTRLQYLYASEARFSFEIENGVAIASLVLPAFASHGRAVNGEAVSKFRWAEGRAS